MVSGSGLGAIIRQFLRGGSPAQQAADEFHHHAHVADNRLPPENVGMGRDAFQQVLVGFGLWP